MKMSAEPRTITVEVVFARPDQQWLVRLTLAVGATVDEALKQSGLFDEIPELRADPHVIGIHGKPVAVDCVVVDGDRVEIYRPLLADPKLTRRRRAAKVLRQGRKS